MPRIVFQDTTVLVNFYRAELLPALRNLRRCGWTGTIALECDRKEVDLELPPGLRNAVQGILEEPLYPEDSEHRKIRQLRHQMAGPEDHPDEHLGEAETIAIIASRGLDAVLATDDRSASTYAHPIQCLTTWDLARLFRKANKISTLEADRLWHSFVAAGGLPPTTIRSIEAYRAWLGGNAPLYP